MISIEFKVYINMIRKMTKQDSIKVLEIYKMGIDTRNAAFEIEIPTWADWNSKHLEHSRFVYVEDENIFGGGLHCCLFHHEMLKIAYQR